MNEKKKGIVLLIVAAVVVLFIVACMVINYLSSKELLDKVKGYYNSSEPKIVVLGKEGCSYCQAFIPEMDFMAEEYGFNYEYISVDKLSSSHYSELLQTLEIDEATFGTPHTVVVQNGEKIDELIGAEEEDVILTFLKDNGFVSKDTKLLINYIGYNEYVETVNSPDTQVVVIGRTSCIYCKMSKPIINNLIKKYNVDVKYVNYDLLSEEEMNLLFKSVSSLIGSEEWGTPAFLIVQNGETLNGYNTLGYLSEKQYIQAFEQYGLIEA